MWNPIWGFDFKVTIDNHVVTISPGQHIAIPVKLELIRGKPQQVDLDVTQWESVGMTASVHFSAFAPGKPWKATLIIKSSPNTPPDSYLFTVRGSAKGTFHTSEDAVTVIVKPKAKQKPDEKNTSQPQPVAVANPSFDLGQLFTPKEDSAPTDRGRAPLMKARKPGVQGARNPAAVLLLVLGPIVFIVVFVIALSQGGGGGGSGSNTSGCPTTCPGGVGVVVPQRCPCPAACPYVYIEEVTGGGLRGKGYKECANRPPR